MGSKCFRPVKQKHQPVYVSSISKAMTDAENLFLQKKLPKDIIIDEIINNENRKGNIKKIFDHLNFHQSNVLPAIKQCSKRTSFDKCFATLVIGSMFCSALVKMLENKKFRSSVTSVEENANNLSISKRDFLTNEFCLRNLIYELQSHFFQLITKILVNTKEKKLQNIISQTLIRYSGACQQKITAKKELKNILELYLNLIFQRNILMINKQSFLSFYAYSALLSKSKTELFTADFVQKHFNFILRLFFELEDTKSSRKSLIDTDDFIVFQDCVQSIIKEFILFSFENKKIKEHIFNEIMLEEDVQKFDSIKTMKLERVIKQNLNPYNQQHFMFDWLGYLLKYIGKKVQNQNQSIRDSLRESIQETPLQTMLSIKSMKNLVSSQSKTNSIETLRRWFDDKLINFDKTLQYFSSRIFQALLLNLYSPYCNSEELSSKSQEVLNYILERRPQGLSQILTILSKQLRRIKNQYYISQHHNLITNPHGENIQLPIVQQEAAQTLWRNDIAFLMQGLRIQNSIFLTLQQVQQIYCIVPKQTRPSINLLFLIQLGSVGLKHCNLENQHVQTQIYNFLISLPNSMKLPDSEIDFEYIVKFVQKIKFMSIELLKGNQNILFSFLKHCFKNLLRQDGEEVWTEILIVILVINLVIEEHKNNNKKRKQKLQNFLQQIMKIVNQERHSSKDVYQVYERNKSLFDISERLSAHIQSFKVKTLQRLESLQPTQINPKSITNIENSVLSSRMDVSESNPDGDFKIIYKIIGRT